MIEHARLIELVAPELKTVYIVDADLAGVPFPPDCSAFTPRYGDYCIEHYLRSSGRWQGPGAMIVLVTDKIPDHGALLQIILHEVAHNLPAVRRLEGVVPTPQLLNWQAQRNAEWAALPPPPHELPPWFDDHDHKFIRRVLHLHHRATVAGFAVPFNENLAAGSYYGLSPIQLYDDALGHEPARMRGATFAEIQAAPMPAAFVELFESDAAAWQRSVNLEPVKEIA